MKAKAFLEKLKSILKVPDTDENFKRALENKALDDLELGDTLDKFDDHLLTRDRALNDKDIVNAISTKTKKESWDKVDQYVAAYLPLIEKDDAEDIGKTYLTWEKMDKLSAAITKRMNNLKTSGSTDDVKKLQERIQQIDAEHATKLKSVEDDWKEKFDAQQAELGNKNLDFILNSKILGHTFAKEYANDKQTLIELKIAKLKKENLLELQQDGSIKVMETDGSKREKYKGSDKVTLDSLIEAEIAPFTKKSKGEGSDGDDGEGNKRKTFSRSTDRNNDKDASLSELRKNSRHTGMHRNMG